MGRGRWVAVLFAAHLTFAQNPVPPTTEIRTTSTLVLVPALVHSAAGELLLGLNANDFIVTDNGVEQKVALEEVERQPVSILVVMQTGGAGQRQFEYYRNVPTLLDAMGGSAKHETAVMTFDSAPEDLFPFVSNPARLKQAFTHPHAGDHGAAVLDAVNYAIDLFKGKPAGTRRIILLLSQPQDHGSKVHAEEVVRRLGENNITIFSVSFSPEKTWLKDQFTRERQGNPPYKMTGRPDIIGTFSLSTPLGVALKAMREDAAAEIASLSGGEHARFDDTRSLEEQLALIANQIPNRYLLSFSPSSNAPGFHALKVQVKGQADPVSVSARTGYWSSADTASAAIKQRPMLSPNHFVFP
ncbi:VWA domain-containing protein [Terriglobus saanensis]|nr:VWA domain-containing protein [Terriglobus saanensis]